MTIPVISLAGLRQGLQQEELRRIVPEMGMFYLTDSDISEDDHAVITSLTMDLFEHSDSEQRSALKTNSSTVRRGFSDLEAESTAAVTRTGDYSDYSKCFSMGKSNNLYPSAAFEKAWRSHFDRLYVVAREIATFILTSTETFAGWDLRELLDCDPVLRLRFFPEVPEHRVAERVPLRMASHYDLSIITLIHQTVCANGFVSLQAEVGGSLVELPPKKDAILVMCGAICTILTKGAITAPKHGVAAPPANMRVGSARTSSVFFLRPGSNFTFSVPAAREYGFDVHLPTNQATFGEWIGTNYQVMQRSNEPPAV